MRCRQLKEEPQVEVLSPPKYHDRSQPDMFINIGADRLDIICIQSSPRMIQVGLGG